jgi:hypothetical protein
MKKMPMQRQPPQGLPHTTTMTTTIKDSTAVLSPPPEPATTSVSRVGDSNARCFTTKVEFSLGDLSYIAAINATLYACPCAASSLIRLSFAGWLFHSRLHLSSSQIRWLAFPCPGAIVITPLLMQRPSPASSNARRTLPVVGSCSLTCPPAPPHLVRPSWLLPCLLPCCHLSSA